MTSTNKQGKMANYVNYRMRATLEDGRQLAGQMLAFDKHMNLVLADTQEFRRVKSKSKKASAPGSSSTVEEEITETRTLGLIIVRGTHVVSMTVEGPPPADPAARLGVSQQSVTLQPGPGISRPAGRGLPVGLTGPAPGVGGPAPPGFGGFPPPGFSGGPPGFNPPPGFSGGPPGAPPGYGGPPGFQPPPGQGRGFPPPGFGR